MATAAGAFIPYGMEANQSSALATEIDAGASADAGNLIQMGFSVPLANELAAQAVAGSGTISNLMALGMPGALAAAVATAIG